MTHTTVETRTLVTVVTNEWGLAETHHSVFMHGAGAVVLAISLTLCLIHMASVTRKATEALLALSIVQRVSLSTQTLGF